MLISLMLLKNTPIMKSFSLQDLLMHTSKKVALKNFNTELSTSNKKYLMLKTTSYQQQTATILLCSTHGQESPNTSAY